MTVQELIDALHTIGESLFRADRKEDALMCAVAARTIEQLVGRVVDDQMRADAIKRERDYGLTTTDVADEMIRSRIPDRFLLDPPDGGDVRTWEAVERIIAAMYKAEREREALRQERDEARALAGEAIDEVQSWASYAPEWAKEKWSYAETLADLRKRLDKDRAP